jgi:hypothetical protein
MPRCRHHLLRWMIRKTTVATKPDHRGEYEAAVKTIRAGKVEPIDVTCRDCRVLFCCTQTAGGIERPPFPAPSVFLRDKISYSPSETRCGDTDVWLKWCSSLRAKQSSPCLHFRWIASSFARERFGGLQARHSSRKRATAGRRFRSSQ